MTRQETLHLDIVSAEAMIFTGGVKMLAASGLLGELGIYPGHTPLITALKPGQIHVHLTDGQEQVFYVSGGMLEVQPHRVTVLSDTAIRADDLDEAAAAEAEQRARQAMKDKTSEFEYSEAATSLAEAVAQIQAIQKLRKGRG